VFSVVFFSSSFFTATCWWDKDTPKGYSWIHFQWFCHRYSGLLFKVRLVKGGYVPVRSLTLGLDTFADRVGKFYSSTAKEASLDISNINTKGKHGSIFKEESTGFQMCADLHKTELDINTQHRSISYLQSPYQMTNLIWSAITGFVDLVHICLPDIDSVESCVAKLRHADHESWGVFQWPMYGVSDVCGMNV